MHELENRDRKLLHRPLAERAAFHQSFMKLKIPDAELVGILAAQRLEYLRGEIEAERISYGEISELQSLTKYIEPSDVQLLEWAGVPETF